MRIPQSSTPRMHKMFNRDVDLVLQKNFGEPICDESCGA
jgi:hypothetical protein